MYSVKIKTISAFTVILIVTSSTLIDDVRAKMDSPADLPLINADRLRKNEQNRESKGICVLPPYPTNGYYVSSIVVGTPGVIVDDYVLNVTCLPGYNLVGVRQFSCLNGWTSGFMPECLPYCDADKRTQVVSCDANALRCLLNTSVVVEPVKKSNDEYDCGELGFVFSHVVAGGHSADPLELPWHVGIYRKTTTPYMQICGGSLVSSNVVISAAHCFWNDLEKLQPASRFAVAVGKLYRPWNNERDLHAQKSDVQDIKIPVRFRGSAANFQDDIAIVIVASSFTYNEHVKPVCLSFDHQLDEKQLKEGNYGKVGGWGLTGEEEKASQVLKAADLPYVDILRCITESPPDFTASITSDKICAGYTNGTTVCKGDSGGGLVFPERIGDKKRHFLRGIVSTAPNNDHACNIYTWATFTHVVNHERFIRNTLHAGVNEVSTPFVKETISYRGNVRTANLNYHATTKPVYQWA